MSQEKTDTLKLDAFSLKTKHQVYIGNARQMTEEMDESVPCVVTSPPYVTTVMEKGASFRLWPLSLDDGGRVS